MFGSSIMFGAINGSGSAQPSTGATGIGPGMMTGVVTGSGTGGQSMIGIMQQVLGGSSGSSTIAPGVGLGMQNMLDIMGSFTTGQTGTTGGTGIFQGMASAMDRVLTGATTATGSFQAMLGAMDAFLADSTAGSANASVSFQTMLDAMQAFLAGTTPGSSVGAVPYNGMLGAMQTFLASANSGAPTASSSFQTMLDIMHNDLFDAKVLSVPATTVKIQSMPGGAVQISGAGGTNTLTDMQRLHFTDESVAMDINGNAGMTAKTLGLVFGADAVSNKTYAGIGLNLLDGGMSYQDLMQTALTAKLGPNFTTADEVNLAYHNLLGTVPSASDVQYWENAVAAGQYTHASLAVMAAETSMNANNIHLVGLAQTGLGYLPVA